MITQAQKRWLCALDNMPEETLEEVMAAIAVGEPVILTIGKVIILDDNYEEVSHGHEDQR